MVRSRGGGRREISQEGGARLLAVHQCLRQPEPVSLPSANVRAKRTYFKLVIIQLTRLGHILSVR